MKDSIFAAKDISNALKVLLSRIMYGEIDADIETIDAIEAAIEKFDYEALLDKTIGMMVDEDGDWI